MPPKQDLSEHYKELLQKKHKPTIKQPNDKVLWWPNVGQIGETIQQNLQDRLLSEFLEWGVNFSIHKSGDKKSQITIEVLLCTTV